MCKACRSLPHIRVHFLVFLQGPIYMQQTVTCHKLLTYGMTYTNCILACIRPIMIINTQLNLLTNIKLDELNHIAVLIELENTKLCLLSSRLHSISSSCLRKYFLQCQLQSAKSSSSHLHSTCLTISYAYSVCSLICSFEH